MSIGTEWTYRLLFVFSFVCVCVCTVTDFSAEEASGVILCTAVYRRPRQEISHFCELPTEAQNWTNRRAHGPRPPACKHYRRDAAT